MAKVAGTGRNQEKFCNILKYFGIEMGQSSRQLQKGNGSRVKGVGSGKFRRPVPPPLPSLDQRRPDKKSVLLSRTRRMEF